MLAVTHLSPPLSQRVEVIILAVVTCVLVFELVRRKRLSERYAILWLVAGLTVLVLGIWKGLLTTLAHAVGIYYAPSALFAVAFLFVLVMLVHFSTTISRLSDQNKVLAQRMALLQQRLERRGEAATTDPPVPTQTVSTQNGSAEAQLEVQGETAGGSSAASAELAERVPVADGLSAPVLGTAGEELPRA